MTAIKKQIFKSQPKSSLQPWKVLLDGNDQDWHSLADEFAPITLSEMDGVALLNRLDTKFLLTTRQLWDVLTDLQQDYWMLEVASTRLNHYRTLYFDTPDFELYQAHVNARPERYKVRSREYTDSHLAFFEVKHRTRKDRTIKDRIRTTGPVAMMSPEINRWLGKVAPIDGRSLEPKLWNSFIRMTLVNRQYCERVTLDLGMAFFTETRRFELDGVAIAEVKMDRASGSSPFLMQMRSRRIHPSGFSKYAMGVAMLYEGVKKNAIKPRLLRMEKLQEGLKLNG